MSYKNGSKSAIVSVFEQSLSKNNFISFNETIEPPVISCKMVKMPFTD
jgi:hypothetical protein